MNGKFSDYIKKRVIEQNTLLNRPLRHSNSDTNLSLFKLTQKHDKNYQTENYNLEKFKYAKRYLTSNHRLNKMLKKDKRRLSDYIVNNPKYIKLYGNKRYHNNPLLFVQDQKKKVDDKKIGLIPVPLKVKKKIKTHEEHKQLYDLQRSIVMMRRFQYNKNYGGSYYQRQVNIAIVIKIQRWWRKITKIILIQAVFRGMLLRKEVMAVKKLFLFMNGFENTLLKVYCRKAIYFMSQCYIVKRRKINVGSFTKNNYVIDTEFRRKIIIVQSIIRQHKSKNKRDNILKTILKFFPVLPKYYITKCSYSNKYVNRYVSMIQKKWRKYSFYKKKVVKKIILPNVITKGIICRPNNPAKLIQNFVKRHHYFVCNEKNKSGFKPKEKQWQFYTRNLINEKMIDSLFIKPKSEIPTDTSSELIKTIYFYTSSPGLITKKRRSDFEYNIHLIQKYGKQLLSYKQNKDNIVKNNYVSKTFVSFQLQKLLLFSESIRKTMRKSFCRKKILYVPINKYSENDIIKIRTIQQKYKSNYYKINTAHKKINSIGYFSKLRVFNNNREIQMLQVYISKQQLKNKKYIESIITDKPISKIGYINKKNIHVVNEEVKLIQFKYRSHLIIKKLKEERDNTIYKFKIKGKNIFMTKKIVINIDEKIKGIKLIQNFYHERYLYLSNNAIDTKDLVPSSLKGKRNLQGKVSQEKGKKYYKEDDIKTTLLSLLKKNRRPLYDEHNYYISKKRVDVPYGYNYSFSYNIPLHQIDKEVSYISKERYYDNTSSILKIQTNFRRSNYITHSTVNRNDYYTNQSNQEPFISNRLLSNKLIHNKEGGSKNDAYYSNYNSLYNNPSNSFYITKKRLLNCNKEIEMIQRHFVLYSNQKKEEKEMFNSNENLLLFKTNIVSVCYLSKDRVEQNTFKAYYKEIQEKRTYIKPIYQFNQHKTLYESYSNNKEVNNNSKLYTDTYKEIDYITKVRKSDILYHIKKLQKKIRQLLIYKNSILPAQQIVSKTFHYNESSNQSRSLSSSGYITKKRKNNFNSNIKLLIPLQNKAKERLAKAKHEKKIELKLIEIIQRPIISDRCIIEKERYQNNEKAIRLLQKVYKKKYEKDRNEEYNTISRKNINIEPLNLSNLINSDRDIISEEERANLVKGIKVKSKPKNTDNLINNYLSNYSSNYESNNKNCDYISKITKRTIKTKPLIKTEAFVLKQRYCHIKKTEEKIKRLQNIIGKYLKFKKMLSSLVKSKEDIYIPPFIFPKQIRLNYQYNFITKKYMRVIHLQKDLSFINLLYLLLVKNAQEYTFNILRLSPIEENEFPFYYNALYRTIKYIQTNPVKGKKVIKFITKVLNLDSGKRIKPERILASLSKEQIKQLQNTNIYSSFEQDFIDYLTAFSKYDKRLSNETFISERLKLSKITNTTIFGIVKFLDEEYENMANGKYCFKCYLTTESCHCTKKSTDADEEEQFDMDLANDDFTAKSLINHFEYDSTKVKGVLIKRKPKIEEAYEDPITHMIINTKKNDITIQDNKSDNKSLEDDRTVESGVNEITNKESKKDKKEMEKIRKILHRDRNENSQKKQVVIRDNTYNSEDLH